MGLRFTLYMTFSLHVLNTLAILLNLTRLERKLCTGFSVTMFLITEISLVVYMQFMYFGSQSVTETNPNGCLYEAPTLYLWLMGNILIFYLGLIIIICYFFRRYCQDPNLEEEERQAYEGMKEELAGKKQVLREQKKKEAEAKKAAKAPQKTKDQEPDDEEKQ